MTKPPPPAARLALPALFVGSVAALLAWRGLLGLQGALGTDAALWGLTARDLQAGAAPLVPPGYPALVGVLHLLGLDLVSAGVAWSVAAAAALPVVCAVVAQRLGASPGRSLLVGVVALLTPDLVGWSQQLQPDALTAVLVVALAGSLASAPNRRPALMAAAVLGGVLPLVREHGAPLAALTVAALLLQAPRRNGSAVIGLVGLWWLGPALVGVTPGAHPMDVPWGDRAGGALAAFVETDLSAMPFLRELHRGDRAAYLDLVARGDRLGQLAWHAGRSLRLAWDAWLWVGLATGLGLWQARTDRRVLWLLVPFVAAAPALLIWSQRRHVALFVPLAVLIVGVVAAVGGRRQRLSALVLGGALLLPWPGHLARLAADQRTERFRAEHFAALGGWICDEAPAHSLLGGVFQDVGLYCPLPRHDPDGTAADWSTFLVSDRPPPRSPLGRWEAVFRLDPDGDPRGGPPAVYRLAPDRAPRPCLGVAPAPGTAYLAVHHAHADLPGCTIGASGAQPPG